jgi:trk system potassium uptake protein TrkH
MAYLPQDATIIVPKRRRGLSPAQLIALSFAATIAIGTLLLSLPGAHAPGAAIGVWAALFTAISAVCVTGLIVVDTGSDYSHFGQTVIMLLIQTGGFGILTLGTLVALVTGRRLGFRERRNLQTQLNALQVGGVVRLLRSLLLVVAGIELVGALLLYGRFAPVEGVGRGAFFALFHSISAFNNVGFALYADSLEGYVGDPLINLTVMTLIILGGLGFVVMVDLISRYRHPRRTALNLHTKIVLTISGLLIGAATVLYLVLEWNNPATLGPLTWPGKGLAALFQAVTPRTAGFNTLAVGGMRESSLLWTMLLMFIGGNPGSTAGGIKTVTFFVLVGSAWSLSRGRGELNLFNRRVTLDLVVRAGVIALISMLLAGAALTALAITDAEQGMLALAFETFSALGTVGLSLGITAELSAPGQLIIMGLMFLGRLGPLTLALALLEGEPDKRIKYPAEEVVIG